MAGRCCSRGMPSVLKPTIASHYWTLPMAKPQHSNVKNDLERKRFNCLVVKRMCPHGTNCKKSKGHTICWICDCDCGNSNVHFRRHELQKKQNGEIRIRSCGGRGQPEGYRCTCRGPDPKLIERLNTRFGDFLITKRLSSAKNTARSTRWLGECVHCDHSKAFMVSHINSQPSMGRCKCGYPRHFGQEVLRQYLQTLLQTSFVMCKPHWLVDPETSSRLELDGYCEQLCIAFEHQGRQHYELGTKYTKEQAELDDIQRRDRVKAELCKEHGVRLLVIKDFLIYLKSDPMKLQESVRLDLARLGIDLPQNFEAVTPSLTTPRKAGSYLSEGDICDLYEEVRNLTHLQKKTGIPRDALKDILGRNGVEITSHSEVMYAISSKGLEDWLHQATCMWGDRFDYSKVQFHARTDNVIIRCKEHDHTFDHVTAERHISGHYKNGGCPKCNRRMQQSDADEIRRLDSQGKSRQEIVGITGWTKSHVGGVLRGQTFNQSDPQ